MGTSSQTCGWPSPPVPTPPPDVTRLYPALRPWVRLLNAADSGLSRLGLRRTHAGLDARGLLRAAERRTGLDDWGDDPTFREALRHLTNPRQDRAALTPVGRGLLRDVLLDRLACRLRIRRFVADSPGVRSLPIIKPLFVVGLPRTGTSLLHALLSQDPACRPLRTWYTLDPARPPRPGTPEAKKRVAHCRRKLARLSRLAGGLEAIHPVAPDDPEECLVLLMNTFMTDAYGLFADFPDYRRWLNDQDMQPAYADYRLQLQILQSDLADGHWVLKSPAHLPNLAALTTVFPDAAVVQTHRDPGDCVPSLLNLRFKALGLGNRFTRESVPGLVAESLDSLRDMLARADAVRAARPEPFLDVQYGELLRDPVAAVRRIYAHFGYAWSGAFERAMRAWLDGHPRGRHGPHSYSAEAFGLSGADIRELFSGYCRRYGIPAANT